MKYILGIDTGGTYTDTILLNTDKKGAVGIEKKSKALTTHENLITGIEASIDALSLNDSEKASLERVVLSTTLATNAIVENNISKVGLVSIGELPTKELATKTVYKVLGKVNIKGRVVQELDENQVNSVAQILSEEVEAIAVSGISSTRNPILEKKVKQILKTKCNQPIVCGSEIVSDLGYWERTNTAIINAGLIGIIGNFTKTIKQVMTKNKIVCPIFIVKGDGNVCEVNAVEEIPINTALSGPAASIIGSIYLTNLCNAVIADMGGTTTDVGVVENQKIAVTSDGAVIGGWKLKIESAKILTFGLGGDSYIDCNDGKVKIGPNRVIPVCRDINGRFTPTDVLHCTDDFTKWNKNLSLSLLQKKALREGKDKETFLKDIENKIIETIYNEIIEMKDNTYPLVAIGAPAKAWYSKLDKKYNCGVVIPSHYEVANAIGAAVAAVQEKSEVLIRKGEDGFGYLLHTSSERFAFTDTDQIIDIAMKCAEEAVRKIVCGQNLDVEKVTFLREDIFEVHGKIKVKKYENIKDITQKIYVKQGEKLVQIQIMAFARGKMF